MDESDHHITGSLKLRIQLVVFWYPGRWWSRHLNLWLIITTCFPILQQYLPCKQPLRYTANSWITGSLKLRNTVSCFGILLDGGLVINFMVYYHNMYFQNNNNICHVSNRFAADSLYQVNT